MAANRINYMSANFSYAPLLTKANYLDALTKFLVSGFGPFDIEKIKVTGKVARVTTTEKNFYSVPGCKLSIAGTGVTVLDDAHEIKQVFSDGFSFDIDIPDREFTNGLTYSVPSLGWSLVKQTAVKAIYKSGPMAVVPFYVIVSRRAAGATADIRYDYQQIQICYELDDIQEPIAEFPNQLFPHSQLMPLHPYLPAVNPTQYAYMMNWFFYGDPVFFICAGDASAYYTRDTLRAGAMGSLSTSAIGECKPYARGVPPTFICGTRLTQADIANNYRAISYNGGNNTSPALCGYTSSASTFIDAVLGIKVGAGANNVSEGGTSFLKRYYTDWSGKSLNRVPGFAGNFSEFTILPMELWDRNGARCGYVPGVYAIDGRPYNIETVPQRPITITINNRARRGVLVRSSSSGSNGTGGSSSTPDSDAVSFLDLTGPLR